MFHTLIHLRRKDFWYVVVLHLCSRYLPASVLDDLVDPHEWIKGRTDGLTSTLYSENLLELLLRRSCYFFLTQYWIRQLNSSTIYEGGCTSIGAQRMMEPHYIINSIIIIIIIIINITIIVIIVIIIIIIINITSVRLYSPFTILLLALFLQPSMYISHLLGHEGKGSLLSELKSRGKWSYNLWP